MRKRMKKLRLLFLGLRKILYFCIRKRVTKQSEKDISFFMCFCDDLYAMQCRG